MSPGLNVLPPSPSTTTSRKHASPTQAIEYHNTLDGIRSLKCLKDPPLGTPDDSPASFPESGSGSGKSRKRVEFSPWTNIHNAPDFTTSSPNNIAVRPLLPSRELSSSGSILKISNQLDFAPHSLEDEMQPQVSLVDMLESITQQLSRNEVTESIDAYQSLCFTLKAYNEVPDAQAFKSKLGPLMLHIRRDLAVLDKSETGPAEINLATQTLKVLVILAWNRNFSTLLNNEIQGFILDRAIQVVEEHKAPKGVMLHYLHLLATQDFRHSLVASAGRVGRLLDALKTLTHHVNGNGTVSERLMVHQRLLEQARPHMKAKPWSWMPELLDGITSFHKETRTKAIELGTKAVAIFPSSSTLSHAFRSVLDAKLEDGKTVGSSACRRLEKMLANKGDGVVVPQIWAIVLSLMKGTDGGIGKWNSLKDWLKIMQRCFNSSNSAIRAQANVAWSRFIYVVSPSEATASLLGILIKPIAAQMERKGMERQDRSSRATAFSAYSHLIYYSFRPSASHKSYDRVWDEYVVNVMTSSFLEKSPAASDRACRIFMSLFWHDNSKSKLWREIRSHENVLMEPEELPTIDSKWIRSKSSSILGMFKLLFKNTSWGSEDRPGQSFVATAWKHFSKAIGAACRKEMKPSAETMEALACILDFLSCAWKTGPSAFGALEENIKDAFITRFRFVCMTVLTEIGAIPLIEGSLPAESVEGFIGKGTQQECPPIIQVLHMLSATNKSVIPNQAYGELVEDLLLLPRKARIPTRLRIRLFRESAVSILAENSPSPTDTARAHIWQAIASAVREEITPSDVLVNLKPEMNDVLEDLIKVLEVGLAYSPQGFEIWAGLLNSAVRFATQSDLQRVANVSMIAESLTSYIEKKESDFFMMEIAELIQCVVPSIELSVTRIPPRQPRGKVRTKTTTLSPLFNKVLFLLNRFLEDAYQTFSAESLQGISHTVNATCECLRYCPLEVFIHCLKALNSSLSLWLQDSQRLLSCTNPVGAVKLTAGRKMCSLLIERSGKSAEHGEGLDQLDFILAAGFRSTQKSTINEMIEMWNTTFGSRKQLVYPQALKQALERLRPFVDLELPGLGSYLDNADIADAPTFDDSQDKDVPHALGFTKSSSGRQRSTGPSLVNPALPFEIRHSASPSIAPHIGEKASKRSPTAFASKMKPRQDESQIQYVAIESSPLQEMLDESQLLTDRQKEIRARRRAEPAVVFPDFRSSPLTVDGLVKGPQNKTLSIATGRMELMEDDDLATPTLPTHWNKDRDEAMASSPTPQSKQPVLRLDDIEVPSSPPSTPGVAGSDAPMELVSSHLVAEQITVFGKNGGSLLLSEPYNINKAMPNEGDGNFCLAAKHSLEVGDLEANVEIKSDALADDELDEHLPRLAYLLSAEGSNSISVGRLKQVVAAAGAEVAVLDRSEVDRIHAETENGAVMETIEALPEEVSDSLAILTEPEMSYQGFEERITIQNQETSAQNAIKGGVVGLRPEISLDVEMAGLHPPAPISASEIDQEKQIDKDLSWGRDHFTSFKADDRLFTKEQLDGFLVLGSSNVTERKSQSGVHVPHSDSDEVDMLSASQLSQDLDWHVALEGRASPTERSPEAEVDNRSRKRKTTFGYSVASKRRKGTLSPTGRGRILSTPPSGAPSQEERREEVFDCIIVDTTPRPPSRASQSSQPSPTVVNTQKVGKKRGRKRKLALEQKLSPAEAGSWSNSGEAFKVEASSLNEEAASVEQPGVAMRQTSSPQPVAQLDQELKGNGALTKGSRAGALQPDGSQVIADNLSNSLPTVLIAIASTPSGDGLAQHAEISNLLQTNDSTNTCTLSDEEGAGLGTEAGLPEESSVDMEMGTAQQMGVIDSLQQVLKRLQSASIGKRELREMDDLLFEIRTEAQHAVGRNVAEQ